MVQSTELAFYIDGIAAKGAKAASFSISLLKPLRGDPTLNVRFNVISDIGAYSVAAVS